MRDPHRGAAHCNTVVWEINLSPHSGQSISSPASSSPLVPRCLGSSSTTTLTANPAAAIAVQQPDPDHSKTHLTAYDSDEPHDLTRPDPTSLPTVLSPYFFLCLVTRHQTKGRKKKGNTTTLVVLIAYLSSVRISQLLRSVFVFCFCYPFHLRLICPCPFILPDFRLLTFTFTI
jgi:hypothetical protein